MYTIGYNFKDTWVGRDNLQFAVRLFTTTQAYAPDPSRVSTQESRGGLTVRADGLIWAGGQQRAQGTLELTLVTTTDGHIEVRVTGSHASEPCKSVLVMVQGLDPRAIVAGNSPRERFEVTERRALLAGHYPVFKMPLVFVETPREEWFALSRDLKTRKKSFGSHYDFFRRQLTLDLAHEEDVRWQSNRIEMPAWIIGRASSREEVVRMRCADLEKHAGLKPWSQRDDIPGWVHDVRLIANLHGEHWTGYVFNTFDQMGDRLEWIAQRIDGRHVLAFLPAWDGRYYFSYPAYEPGPRLGGAEGLKRFVERAHKLGIHVVPMLGANAANVAFLEKAGLMHTILRNEYGIPEYCDWVDWDSDLSPESHTVLANIGHPDFRNHLLERSTRLVKEFGVDGIFLDISGLWRNCPDHSPYEGTLAWAEEMRRRHPGTLLMGEFGHDLLWNAFGIFSEGYAPLGHCDALLRYARSGYYLAHRAPGSGSGGIHEHAWFWDDVTDDNRPFLIPTIGVTDDTTTVHAAAAESEIAFARAWQQRLHPWHQK